MAHHELTTPITEAQTRALRIDDTVTLQRTLFGIRDATQIAMFDRGRATRFDLAGHAVIHTAPNVKKVARSPEHPAGLRAGVHRHDDLRADGALHAAAADAVRRAPHHRQGRPRRGVARRVRRARRRVSRDHRRHRGAGDDLDRSDRGRRSRRPQSRKPVAISHPRFRPVARGDGQPRRQPLHAVDADARGKRAQALAALGVRSAR